MPAKSVLVTYTLHPYLQPSAPSTSASRSPLITALEGIKKQLPLTNLHWKPSNRSSIRTIQNVDVDMVELGEAGTFGKEPAGSLLEWPLVNLCMVLCESDEVYKTQTRSFIRDWLSLLAARRNVHAPLIVLVNTPTTAAAASGKSVFGRDKGVIAKLRADFNSTKRDRCVQINLPPEGKDDPAVWVEIINKLKESILLAFDGAIMDREEEVKRGEAQRLTVGWNFCTWFLLKESLAHSFEGVNLYEDALIVYEELEATFIQVLKEHNLSWFGKLGATGAKDDSLPILDASAKPYRELLQTSSISIFDFRVYVFARQAQLLGKLGRITEIAKRGQWFVASLTRRLRENEAELAQNFIEAWTYTACMDILYHCDEWSRIDRPNGDYSGLIAYESARSELLDIARTQVERIGVAVGHLPNEYPFAQSSAPALASDEANDDVLFESSDNGLSDSGGADPEPSLERQPLSSPELLEAVADKEKFIEMYLSLTQRAIQAYEACHKANSAIRLKADLAALALLKEDWVNSYGLCRDLAKECAELSIWEPAAKFALSGALKAHRHLALEKSEDWTNLALAYLRATALLPAKDEGDQEAKEVLDGLKEVTTEYTADDHKALSARLVKDTADFGSSPDLNVAHLEIINRLSSDVSIDTVQVDLVDFTGESVSFSCGNAVLHPGPNAVDVTCTSSVQGIFALQEIRLALGKVTFAYLAQVVSALKIYRNPKGVRTMLRMPHDISLDRESTVILEVHSGGCELKDAKVSLVSLQDDVRYILTGATSADAKISASEEEVALGDLPAGKTVLLSMPYAGNPQSETAQARVIITYTSAAGDARRVVDGHSVAMGLPLTVNVQDFFRPKCLVSHFTIASDGREFLRVAEVKLDEAGVKGYTVESARKEPKETVIAPSSPLSCLFKISKQANADPSAVLRLVIRYRSLEEEARALVEDAAGENLKLARLAARTLEDKALWVQEYITTSTLSRELIDAVGRAASDASVGDLAPFQTALTLDADTSKKLSRGQFRTLEIPVDVPQRRLLTSVRFDQAPHAGPVAEGRAITLKASFNTTFAWTGSEDTEPLDLVWDISVSQDDWVILGKKKGRFTATPGQKKNGGPIATTDIVLLPVRPGTLYLPTVNVSLFPKNDESKTEPISQEDALADLICEAFVENAGDTVRVLPATSSRTVLVPVPPREWE